MSDVLDPILAQGLLGAAAVVFAGIAYNRDRQVQKLNDRLLDESLQCREDMMQVKDSEMARQIKQLEMYTEFEKTIEEFGKILERLMESRYRRG